MEIKFVMQEDPIWRELMQYALDCSWSAGPWLAKDMAERRFKGWERVLVAMEGNAIAGYCTLAKTDCIPEVPYSPYIGYVFVGEPFRGNRLSEKMIDYLLDYANQLGFEKVYLVSDHEGLYEKYGFVVIDQKPDSSGRMEQIFVRSSHA